MADANDGRSDDTAPDGPASQPVQVQVLSQFIKDLSFENPNSGRPLHAPGDNPNLKLDINVSAHRVEPDVYESAIEFNAQASSKAGVIYELELIYAGHFRIKNIPEHALEPFLLINCPTLMFPFVRRLVADLTREGGFPPLLLDPLDFGGLYLHRQKQEMAGKAPN